MRLYVLVRKDIAGGLGSAQAVHAALGFVLNNVKLACIWQELSNNVVCLAVDGEDHLKEFSEALSQLSVEHEMFVEPDLGGQVTALATIVGPLTAKIFSDLKLFLSGHHKQQEPLMLG